MKFKPIITVLLVVLVLSLFACSALPQRLIIVAPVDDSSVSREVEIAAGGSLVICLDSNPTTGFSWQLTGISDQAVLKQDGEPEFIPPEETVPGESGREMWTFKALKEGRATISLEYNDPRKCGEKRVKTYDLPVTVK